MVTTHPIHIGDLGTYLQINFRFIDVDGTDKVLDLSPVGTVVTIIFIRPDETTAGPFAMTLVTNGTDGEASYTTSTASSIWTQSGTWKWYGNVTFSGGSSYNSEEALHVVYSNT